MNIKVDSDKCLGCASCMAVAPGSFEMKDDDKVHGINPPQDDLDMIKAAADSCPTQAISVEE